MFQPRYFDTILMDMIAHVRANTEITDFSIGSVIRTILEAAAIEDDEQYHQIVELLKDFRFTKARGDSLKERAADFNTFPLPPSAAITKVKFYDDALIKNTLSYNVAIGATLVELDDSGDFPVTPPNFTIRIGEGTERVEDIVVANHNVALSQFTCPAALVNAHSSGERIALVVAGASYTLPSGIRVQVPATYEDSPIVFEVVEGVTKLAGNFESTIATAKAVNPGMYSAGVGAIKQFSASPPFTGARVSNITTITGGRDPESDERLVARLTRKLNELSRGIPAAVEACLIGLQDPTTNQQIISANLVESFLDNQHTIYIDDGTGFEPTKVTMPSSNIQNGGVLASPAGAIPITSTANFPASGYILVSPEDPGQAELLFYTAKSGNNLVLLNPTGVNHDDLDQVLLVDIMLAEEAQNYFRFNYFPFQKNSYRIFTNATGSYVENTEGSDYFLNRTNGEIEFSGGGLPSGSYVVGHYTYFTGLFAQAQKTLNGELKEIINYPGFAAAGTIIYIDVPVICNVSVIMQAVVANGFDDIEVNSIVKTVIESYIGGLFIGENVIISKLIDLAMDVEGVTDVKVLSPTENVIILENELPKPFDAYGNSLVTVY